MSPFLIAALVLLTLVGVALLGLVFVMLLLEVSESLSERRNRKARIERLILTPDDPDAFEAALAAQGAEALPDPPLEFPAWLADLRAHWVGAPSEGED